MQSGAYKEAARRGLPLSPGVVVARVCRLQSACTPPIRLASGVSADARQEMASFDNAIRVAVHRIESLRREAVVRLGEAEAEIFATQKLILEDETWHREVADRIVSQHAGAAGAVVAVLDAHEARMRDIEDEYLRDRASDIVEIKQRVLRALSPEDYHPSCGDGHPCRRGQGCIVVAEELLPSMTLEMDTENVLGLLSEHGGVSSHAAILARALGIPAVSGLDGIYHQLSCDTEVALDGTTGEVVVAPRETTKQRFRELAARASAAPEPTAPVDGFVVLANINLATESAEAGSFRAEGVGLYRTEYEFLATGRFLDEDEQLERYRAVIRSMPGMPVTFRLFDGGGDKVMPFLPRHVESNPALGWRGSRLLLDRPDLLAVQARALARASCDGPIRILYPMVIDRRQYERLRQTVDAAIAGTEHGSIEHGVMLEVPSACLQARDLLDACDFVSVGTNDLIQHLFAVDRNNPRVAHDYDPDRPVFWSLMAAMADAARAAGKSITICGELAADPGYVLRLMELGITSVSVSPRLIPAVRRRVKEILSERELSLPVSGMTGAGI
jgi:phosphoenolpyruvate-protein phosphotransferase